MGKRLAAKVDRQRWKGSTLATLQYLALEANKHGILRDHSMKKIADDMDMSWQRIKVIMQSLRTGGAVEIIKRGGGTRSNVYRLHI